ncbi:UNVERIFIED_ORG: hypothetical protein EDF86_1968 [Pseudomonas psychrophila]
MSGCWRRRYNHVVVDSQREATSDGAAIVNPEPVSLLKDCGYLIYDCYAAGRSLAVLVNDYAEMQVRAN